MHNIFSKVFGLIIFLLSIFLIIFIIYREKYFYADIKIASSNIYYSLALIGIIVSFIVFYLPSRFSKNLFSIFIIMIFTIYISEYSLNYINFKDSIRISAANKNGTEYDKRTIYEVVKDLKKKIKKKLALLFLQLVLCHPMELRCKTILYIL